MCQVCLILPLIIYCTAVLTVPEDQFSGIKNIALFFLKNFYFPLSLQPPNKWFYTDWGVDGETSLK